MDTLTLSDAQYVWEDFLGLLYEQNLKPALLTMLESCTISNITDTALVITVKSSFARKKITEELPRLEKVLSVAAYQPLRLEIQDKTISHKDVVFQTHATSEEIKTIQSDSSQDSSVNLQNLQITEAEKPNQTTRKNNNELMKNVAACDSKLTFERFVSGDENILALDAAKQVANGQELLYNTTFIFGKSGLGKTHLLRAIQNYILKNDSSRLCLYRTAKEFQNDYVNAINDSNYSAREALTRNYRDIDVLIIDDIQNLSGLGTIQFFFEVFNYLANEGKHIVIASDRTPVELGLAEKNLDERVISRLGSGMIISIDTPSDEFKYVLVNNFYKRMKEDAVQENIPNYTGTISEENLRLIADKSGNNIRTIAAFCSECLITATRKQEKNEIFGREDIVKLAKNRFNPSHRIITIKDVQKAVEEEYSIEHEHLIGNKRNKDMVEARHVAIFIARELTNSTLAEIGDEFGGRSHATVLHSVDIVKKQSKDDRLYFNRIKTIKDTIIENAIQ